MESVKSPSAIDALLSYAEPALSQVPAVLPDGIGTDSPRLRADLLDLLHKHNGCFVFYRALHLFPTHSLDRTLTGYDIGEWNRPDLWKHEFPKSVQGLLCFAEDIFGCQWALQNDRICKFDPETGEATPFADDLESWAERILQAANVETAWPLAEAWMQQYGDLPANLRLCPKQLFILGGAFTVENLFAVEAGEGMRFRGDIARQIRDLPDGAKIKIVVK